MERNKSGHTAQQSAEELEARLDGIQNAEQSHRVHHDLEVRMDVTGNLK